MAGSGTLKVPNNLRADLTSFVGRRREIADVKASMAASRLVTITGMGGVGKTRLARQIAASVSRAFTDGVWEVELADLEDEALLADTIARALGFRQSPDRWAIEAVAERIGDRHLLVILDNCEHLVDACAAAADGLLGSCPRLHILATSRELLGVRGERACTLDPFTVPDPAAATRGSLVGNDAVTLFVERALDVCPTFAIDSDNAATVADLCVRLDGVPLALELAAVWTRVLAPGELLRQLAEHHRLLAKGPRGAPIRQQSLRALVDWSYQLCTPEERLLWRQASVFAHSFEFDGVATVCRGDESDDVEVVEIVDRLAAKSIIYVDRSLGVTRYRMPEMIRTFGLERLADAGEEERLRQVHLDWCLDLAARARSQWVSSRQVDWFQRMRREVPNIRAALEFALSRPGGGDQAVQLIADLTDAWVALGFISEGLHWVDRARAADLSPAPRLTALRLRAIFAALAGDTATSSQLLEEAWPDAGDASDEELAWLTYASALAAMTRGDSGVARALMADAVAKFRATDDINGLVWALCDSAVAESTSTEPGETEAYVAAFQAVAGPLQLFGAAYALWARAHARWRAGDTVGARMAVLESLQATRPFDDHLARGLASELLAWITQRDGSPHDAAVQLGRAAAAFASAGSSIDAVDYLAGGHKTCQAQLVGQLGPDGFATAYDAGFREEPSWDAGSAAAVAEPDRTPAPNQPSRLTRREAEVAGLVAQGLTNKEIATRLVLSQRTVEAHVEHALVKLGFRSRGQLAAWVVSQDDAAT